MVLCAGFDVGVTTIVFPSLPNEAMMGTLAFTVSTAEPLFSVKVADEMTLLPKVRVGEAGETSGSREKVIRSTPWSVAMMGFTGAVK